MARILVGMSGGVDSSVAAAMLVRAGHDVIGVSIQLYDRSESGRTSRCCSPEDFLDARRVSERLGIRYYVVNREELFERRVLEDFVKEYRGGRTPNPCVHCNAEVKFESLTALARDLGAAHVATGHYARLHDDPATGARWLLRARDENRDQSYFLFDLSEAQIGMALFPLGDSGKDEVRSLARELGLVTADKPDSQDVCFLEDADYRGFIARRIAQSGGAERGGPMVDASGRVLGRHEGLSNYTMGQRRGLGVSGGKRLYVIDMDPESNAVTLGTAEELDTDRMEIDRVRFIGPAPVGAFECLVRVRHRHAGVRGRVTPLPGGRGEIAFDAPVRGGSPGQAAVFYDGDRVIGGGWIDRVERTHVAGTGAADGDGEPARVPAGPAGTDRTAPGCATIGPVERA